MTTEEYLRSSTHPLIVDAFARMERGDINYIDAVERIAVQLLAEVKCDPRYNFSLLGS